MIKEITIMSKFDDLREEMTDYLNDINKDGVIEYNAYSDLFDFAVDLLDKAFEAGQKAGQDTKSKRQEFDLSNIKTGVNADDVLPGDVGYLGDNLNELRDNFNDNRINTIHKIGNEDEDFRFETGGYDGYNYFYPLEGAK